MRTSTFRLISICLALLVVIALAHVGQPLLISLPNDASLAREPDAEPGDYRTVVIFRNDDVEPGNRDDLRRTVDRVFIEEGVPVTNSVIPTSDNESIATNESFCQELRQTRRDHPDIIEYALHGYFHEPTTTEFDERMSSGHPSEFGGLEYEEQRERIGKGADNLEDCLGERPETFVPPFGTYDNETVRALATENISTISGGDWFTNAYYNQTSHFETNGVLHVPRQEGFVRNWGTHAFYDGEHLRRNFDHAYEHGHLYVHVLHYWTFTSDEKLQQLRTFVRYTKDYDGVLFMTVGQFADAYRDGRLTKTEQGWRYTPPENGTDGVSGTTPIG